MDNRDRQDALRKEFEAWILEVSNEIGRVIDLAYIQRHYLRQISYS